MSHEQVTAEFIIRKEIKNWFKKTINDICGPAANIRYLPIDNHFNTHMYGQISICQCQINQAMEFIKNTSDMLSFKALWLNEHSYYVLNSNEKEKIENRLKIITKNNCEVTYICSTQQFIGLTLTIFHFNLDLDAHKINQINCIFDIFAYRGQQILSYPKKIGPIVNAAASTFETIIDTRMLTACHGNFLNYLSLKDILSLEIANKPNDFCHNVDLDHDIQNCLRNHFPDLYDGVKRPIWSIKDFKIKDVLYYFIHKYHDRLTKIEIPNILAAGEIQSLSRLYNIDFEYNNIVHIDFKSWNNVETIDFCAICHFHSNPSGFFNYDSNFAVSHSMSFNADDDFHDSLQCHNEFTLFVLESHKNCSTKKLNSILKLIVEHFIVCQSHLAFFILYEFDLNNVSRQIINSLLKMIRHGSLMFHTISLTSKTLMAILQQSDQNNLEFKECHFIVEKIEKPQISIISKIGNLRFSEMDLDLNYLHNINVEIKSLFFEQCRILSPSRELAFTNMNILDMMWFYYCSMEISTLLTILNKLQCVKRLGFFSCIFNTSECIEEGHFILQNEICFRNLVFDIHSLFQIIRKYEIQKMIFFDNCVFRVDENDNRKKFSLKRCKIQFQFIKFNYSTLLTILKEMNSKSEVCISKSSILRLDQNAETYISTKLIHTNCIQFAYCRVETRILLQILGEISQKTKVIIACCDLLHSKVKNLNILTRFQRLVFYDMKLNSHDLFGILSILKRKSSVELSHCILIPQNGESFEIIQEPGIEISFYNMTIESDMAELLLRNHFKCIFNKCHLKFMTDELSTISIQANVTFVNMFFDFATHLKCLAKFFTPKSRLAFQNCQFKPIMYNISNNVIQSLSILFIRTIVDLDVLIQILERISDRTQVTIDQCEIQPNSIFLQLPIKILNICFKNMTLELEIISLILEKFTSQSSCNFDSCKILCSDPNKIAGCKLIQNQISLRNMVIDCHVFQIFVQMCHKTMMVELENCKMSGCMPLQPTVSNEIGCLFFRNMSYSPEILQILQYINRKCMVIYFGEISNRSIIEICLNSPVYGERLRIINQSCKTMFPIELFAEFFLPIALDFQDNSDTEIEYNLPVYLVPDFRYCLKPTGHRQYDWKALKIRIVKFNDVSVKLEFCKHCETVNIFQELSDFSDDYRDKF